MSTAETCDTAGLGDMSASDESLLLLVVVVLRLLLLLQQLLEDSLATWHCMRSRREKLLDLRPNTSFGTNQIITALKTQDSHDRIRVTWRFYAGDGTESYFCTRSQLSARYKVVTTDARGFVSRNFCLKVIC